MLTKQEIFDKVWDYFVVQGKPRSSDANGKCQYLTDDGCRCAVGVLMPDNVAEAARLLTTSVKGLYDSLEVVNTWVTDAFGDLVAEEPRETSALLHTNMVLTEVGKFAQRLQNIHDYFVPTDDLDADEEFTDYMRERLTFLAEEHNLKVPTN